MDNVRSFRARLRDAAKLLAIMLLIISLPALLLLAMTVLITSPGPAFVNRLYRRQDGRTVDLWELRTECWVRWQPTPVGLLLRRSNAYRLPALYNIIKGDIALGERVKPAQEWNDT